MMAVRRIRAERSPNRAARLRQEHNTLLACMPELLALYSCSQNSASRTETRTQLFSLGTD